MNSQDSQSQPAEPQDAPHLRIITLTRRRPVEIVDHEWPEIAKVECETEDEAQHCRMEFALRVRRHADNIFLVYSTCDYYRDVDPFRIKFGEMVVLHSGDTGWAAVVSAIRSVAQDVMIRMPEDRRADDGQAINNLIPVCIAKLTPQDLTRGNVGDVRAFEG